MSTKVGGVPEVLPPSMINFAEPKVEAIAEALIEAVSICRRISSAEFHERVKVMYSWPDVASRTLSVYEHVSRMRRYVPFSITPPPPPPLCRLQTNVVDEAVAIQLCGVTLWLPELLRGGVDAPVLASVRIPLAECAH